VSTPGIDLPRRRRLALDSFSLRLAEDVREAFGLVQPVLLDRER